jgi:hypothetical protein
VEERLGPKFFLAIFPRQEKGAGPFMNDSGATFFHTRFRPFSLIFLSEACKLWRQIQEKRGECKSKMTLHPYVVKGPTFFKAFRI